MVLTSDASGSWGCGVFSSTGLWFQLALPDSWQEVPITMKELLPIVLAAMWGSLWRGFTVSCRCDNAAVVNIVNSGKTMDRAMHVTYAMPVILPGPLGHDVHVFSHPEDQQLCCQCIVKKLPVFLSESGARGRGKPNSHPRGPTPVPGARYPGLDQGGVGGPVLKL